ncbi:toxin-antitoxin system, antitoxin component, Xre family protein [Citroniella saccharovorans]|uniref:Toxin-antitoxin system, antitoxin component, Xre family protein n=1 Tax=Citroniella saccharovorans TaxID=2053367 RepID=A0AAW9MTG7_9FIRM|nr:toxin-antitoxin system, antitoxin component, Xre family protein [Citroniella saccharovorans]MEB3428889.1 toxin-antitoxin system, antitoxin component, Xre family protein [Citroniella saccharovorans]
MTDTIELNYKIKDSGYKLQFLADQLNINRATLYNKIYNRSEFYAKEIQLLSDLLDLTSEERESIFFNNKVDN